MTDKLDWKEDADKLMEYIYLIECFLVPDFEEYRYKSNITFVPVSKEEEELLQFEAPLTATECMRIFYDRYNAGKIAPKFAYEEYISNDTIQSLIKSLELDRDKFWLFILFLYDYCESMFYQGVTMKPTPMEQLQELYVAISNAEDAPMTLTFKSEKRKAVLDSPAAIKAIASMIASYMETIDENQFKELNRREREDKPTMLKESPYIAFFAKNMLTFFDFQPQIRAKRKKGANHSIKETDLVCQLIYFTKLSRNKCWTLLENETLKAYLKQYKNYEYPNNVSSIYPEFA